MCPQRDGELIDWAACSIDNIIHISRTAVLGLPRKQNGNPIGCIKLLGLISQPNVDLRTYEGLSMV